MEYVYIADASTFCEDCAPNYAEPDVNGSEWDTPIHCSQCHKLIWTVLTSDGINYVIQALRDGRNDKRGNAGVLANWRETFNDELTDADYFVNVHYRIMDNDEVIALFPDLPYNAAFSDDLITSYMHVGQHGAASDGLIDELPTATDKQRSELHAELTGVYDDNELVIADDK